MYKISYLIIIIPLILVCSCKKSPQSLPEKSLYTIGEVLLSDDFSGSLSNWIAEGKQPKISDGQMELNAASCSTVWLRPMLMGNVLIEYDITIAEQSSSGNEPGSIGCFAMATDPTNPKNFLAGIEDYEDAMVDFSRYNNLNLYYVEPARRDNKSSKLMRFANGQQELLNENSDSPYILIPNQKYHIQLFIFDKIIEFHLNSKRLLYYEDTELYTQGYFGITSTANKILIDNFKITHLYLAEIE